MGSNVYRNYPRTTTLEQADRFLTLIDGWKPDVDIRLTGGEPTAVGPEIIHEMCNIVHKHGRKVDILTNGYRLQEIDPHLLDFITLDNHGVNEQTIKECQQYLLEKGYKNFNIITYTHHRDLESQRKGNISNGPKCMEWMDSILLWEETVYPCCVMPFLEGFDSNPRIGESLREAGWTIKNPNLVETLKDWHETIPAVVVRACVLGCWRGSDKRVEWHKIGDTKKRAHLIFNRGD